MSIGLANWQVLAMSCAPLLVAFGGNQADLTSAVCECVKAREEKKKDYQMDCRNEFTTPRSFYLSLSLFHASFGLRFH